MFFISSFPISIHLVVNIFLALCVVVMVLVFGMGRCWWWFCGRGGAWYVEFGGLRNGRHVWGGWGECVSMYMYVYMCVFLCECISIFWGFACEGVWLVFVWYGCLFFSYVLCVIVHTWNLFAFKHGVVVLVVFCGWMMTPFLLWNFEVKFSKWNVFGNSL